MRISIRATASIASFYKRFGEGWHVRWDYAFFQMAIETNFLKFRRGDGQPRRCQRNTKQLCRHRSHRPRRARRAVSPTLRPACTRKSSTSSPIPAKASRSRSRRGRVRTRTTSSEASQRLGRPVTFGDLARRWATDRHYGKSIDFIAGLYSARYCSSQQARSAEDIVPPAPQPAHRRREYPFQPPSGLGGPKPDMLAGPKAGSGSRRRGSTLASQTRAA